MRGCAGSREGSLYSTGKAVDDDVHRRPGCMPPARGKAQAHRRGVQDHMARAQRGLLPPSIRVPRPFNLDTFCADLVVARDRDLTIEPVEFGCEISGLWLPLPDHDIVYYETGTTPAHQLNIVLHELAHMILDHPHDPVVVRALRGRLVRLVDVAAFDRLFARTTFSEAAEQDAENLVVEILCESRRSGRPSADSVVGRLEQIFG
jgi:hypothetical protein